MTSTDRIAQPWGTRTPYGPGADWPVRVDTYLQEGTTAADVDRWVQTASILHSNGDAMDIAVRDERIVAVRDRVEDRVNHGRLGPSAATGIDKRNIRRRQGEKPEQLIATDLREPAQPLQLLLREHLRHQPRPPADPRFSAQDATQAYPPDFRRVLRRPLPPGR